MEKFGCESIWPRGFPLSHLLHDLLHLSKRNWLGEVLIILPYYSARDQGCDPINILAPLIVVLCHDFLEMIDQTFFHLSPSPHLGPVGEFKVVNL